MKTEGFIFGHYDSRGGGTFIEGTNELEARRKYLDLGSGLAYEIECAERWSKEEGSSPMWAEVLALRDDEEALIRYLTEEDFITSAKLETYRNISEGEDLEWGEHQNPEQALANAFEDGISWAAEEVQSTTANPFQELLWWNEEKKELRLCPKGVNPADPEAQMGTTYWPTRPREPGWVRSSFGEDACGLVFVSAEYTE